MLAFQSESHSAIIQQQVLRRDNESLPPLFSQGLSSRWGLAFTTKLISDPLQTLRAVSEDASAGGLQGAAAEEWVATLCWIGKQDCGMLVRKVGDRVVKLEGNPAHPRNSGTLCPKGMAQISALYDPNRVRRPLVRTNEKGVPGRFREVSWEEALELVASKIREARAQNPKLVVWQKGRSKSSAT